MISDRDRFSYQGLFAEDRITSPMVKQAGEWKTVDWDDALQQAVAGLQSVIKAQGAEQLLVGYRPAQL